LKSRRKDLEAQTALVEAGRRARVDLVQQKASVAEAERQLLNTFNELAQAKSDLLNIIDTNKTLDIVVPNESIEALTNENLPQPVKLSKEALLQKAYAQRPDYLQAKINVNTTRLDLIEQRDNLRWQLDTVSSIDVGDDIRASAALELTQTFGDKSPKTALLSSRVNLLQQRSNLEETKQTVAVEISDRIRDINSNFAQVREARQATKLAQERLKVVRELYLRGRDGIGIFEVTSQQDEVVAAQNTELNTVIDYLNAWTDLEQSSGMTLNTW
jgi:outer membrane protein